MKAVRQAQLRASWGIIGNEKISYYDRYARVQSSIIAVLGNPDAPIPAATYGKSGNPDLRWESTTQTDVGAEVGFLANRLTGEFDFYNRVTNDILVELSTPGHLGNGQGQKVRYNAASVLNRGYEFNVNWREKVGEFPILWAFLINIHNEVLEIGWHQRGDSTHIRGTWVTATCHTESCRTPIGAFYGYKTTAFSRSGRLDAYPIRQAGLGLRFVDVTNDGVIDGRTDIHPFAIPKFISDLTVPWNTGELTLHLISGSDRQQDLQRERGGQT